MKLRPFEYDFLYKKLKVNTIGLSDDDKKLKKFLQLYEKLNNQDENLLTYLNNRFQFKYKDSHDLTLRPIQQYDSLNLIFSYNKLVSHETRVGKNFLTTRAIMELDDIKNIIVIFPKSVAMDKDKGLESSLNKISGVCNLSLSYHDVIIQKSNKAKLKVLIDYFLFAKQDKNFLVINPQFLTASKLGKTIQTIFNTKKLKDFEIGHIIDNDLFSLINTNSKKEISYIESIYEALLNIKDQTSIEEKWTHILTMLVKRMNSFTFDLGMFDEFHEYIGFNNKLLLATTLSKTLLIFRKRRIKRVWAISATPLRQSILDTLGYLLFINFEEQLFKNLSFNKLFKELISFFGTYRVNNFNVIDFESFKFRKKPVDMKNVYKQMLQLYQVEKKQKDVNANKLDIIIEKVELDILDYQKKVYDSFKNILSNDYFSIQVQSDISRIAYERELALDHRLLVDIFEKRIINVINNIAFNKNGRIIDNIVFRVYQDSFLKKYYPNNYEKLFSLIWKKEWTKDEFKKMNLRLLKNLTNKKDEFKKIGTKSKYIIDKINNANNLIEEPIIILCNFSSFLYDYLIHDIVKFTNLNYEDIGLIHGGTKQQEREQIIQMFNRKKLKIIIANIKTLQAGVNLSRSNLIIYLDLPWRNNAFIQSVSRIDDVNNTSVQKKCEILFLKDKDYGESIDEMVEKTLARNKNNTTI